MVGSVLAVAVGEAKCPVLQLEELRGHGFHQSIGYVPERCLVPQHTEQQGSNNFACDLDASPSYRERRFQAVIANTQCLVLGIAKDKATREESPLMRYTTSDS